MNIRDAVQFEVRRFSVQQFDVPPELPHGWQLLGVEIVVHDERGSSEH